MNGENDGMMSFRKEVMEGRTYSMMKRNNVSQNGPQIKQ